MPSPLGSCHGNKKFQSIPPHIETNQDDKKVALMRETEQKAAQTSPRADPSSYMYCKSAILSWKGLVNKASEKIKASLRQQIYASTKANVIPAATPLTLTPFSMLLSLNFLAQTAVPR